MVNSVGSSIINPQQPSTSRESSSANRVLLISEERVSSLLTGPCVGLLQALGQPLFTYQALRHEGKLPTDALKKTWTGRWLPTAGSSAINTLVATGVFTVKPWIQSCCRHIFNDGQSREAVSGALTGFIQGSLQQVVEEKQLRRALPGGLCGAAFWGSYFASSYWMQEQALTVQLGGIAHRGGDPHEELKPLSFSQTAATSAMAAVTSSLVAEPFWKIAKEQQTLGTFVTMREALVSMVKREGFNGLFKGSQRLIVPALIFGVALQGGQQMAAVISDKVTQEI